jgi:hypothetical protein
MGAYFKQGVRAEWAGGNFAVDLQAPEGTFATSVRSYVVRLHGVKASTLRWQGHGVSRASALPATVASSPVWTTGSDRFGDVIEVRIKAGVHDHFELTER